MKKLLLILFSFFYLTSYSQVSNKIETAIRGVWVPAPRFTDVLHSYQNVKDFVHLLDELQMNAIFLVSYAETQTIYKSKVLTEYSTYESEDQSYLLASYIRNYQSPTDDPVRDLLDEAHKKGIKVFFWFEYGFMGEGRPISNENPLLAKNPTWLGIGNDGKPSNYNEHDYYFNAYNPSVQKFITKLIEESIDLYPDIDGIQGDDRLPAMPRNSGYDEYTISLYQREHNNKPPHDFNDPKWVRWRLNILNEFAKQLYTRVKAKNPQILVSFAPNPYPWCEQMLMQEWPQWCKDGVCDLLAVQCYRYSKEAYYSTVADVLKYIRQSNPNQLFAPGMILQEGSSSKMTPELLIQQIQVNRELGINGEIFFYNKALENPAMQNALKTIYKTKIPFPNVNNRP